MVLTMGRVLRVLHPKFKALPFPGSLKGVKLLVCNSNPQLMHALESRTYLALDAQARSNDIG